MPAATARLYECRASDSTPDAALHFCRHLPGRRAHATFGTSPVVESAHRPTRDCLLLALLGGWLRALLTYDAEAVGRDLPGFVSMMLATGLRIGECIALTWGNVDLEAGTVTVKSAVVRLEGPGLSVKSTKTQAKRGPLALPSWCVRMLRETSHGCRVSSSAAFSEHRFQLQRKEFPTFNHPPEAMLAVLGQRRLRNTCTHRGCVWQVAGLQR